MSYRTTTFNVEAPSPHRARMVAATAATLAGQIVVTVGVPEKDEGNKWNVPVHVLGIADKE